MSGVSGIMKKSKRNKPKYAKETPDARKKRASSGVKFRAVVFEDKRRKLSDKAAAKDEPRE